MERSKEKDYSQLLKDKNIIKAIYQIKQARNDIKCDTIAKCFEKGGFADNTAKNLAKKLLMQTIKKVWMTQHWRNILWCSCEESL